ncbi:hypothetical protein U0070_014469 [Myodes glareolus]|uniref:Uncharacterized protein n=1 Tax=Myodes glareolus TaxID=447135 RepID=A0AAW0J4B7_MYOGA
MMVKARVNRFAHVVCLVTFNSGEVDAVPPMTSSTDLNYVVYIFIKTHSTVMTEDGKLVINIKAISIFQE